MAPFSQSPSARFRRGSPGGPGPPRWPGDERPPRRRTRGLRREEVAQRYGESKTILHPALGRIDVDAQVLFTENRAQTLVVMIARPGTESQGKLELLSVIGQQQLTP
ncbi:MmyB family transcriptional regulator [Streptomyces prunicolor]|uniref:MmyB family transcriptional regulator n=1 Tax=Streptomyces prunicolor TaxID=67348 RepID=UPI001FE0DE1C|nr:hypothetical protein [Streptomyces prunicolor]